jgi:glycosyltransferase involved in cell wall biosynthesis
MSKLFIDVTELAGWQGRLTGVPRVMHELSARFAASSDTRFVTWDSSLKKYHEISFSQLNIGQDNVVNTQPLLTSREGAAQLAKSLVAKSPAVKKVALKFRKGLSSNTSHDRNGAALAGAQKGDILFVLCDWHGSDSVFIDALKRLNNSGVKLVHMLYDMLPLVTPQYSGHASDSLRIYSQQVYPLCDLMFSISANTKKDVINWLEHNGLEIPPIQVIRLGDDFQFAGPIKPEEAYFAKESPFLLCVGTVEARKNHTLLYYAYKLAHSKGIDLPTMVIVGRKGWKANDIYDLITSDPETKPKFLLLGDTNDEELSWLYDNCLFSVYPSFYEGWGLPIAESLARGVPCACSNTSSMTEIADDLPYYFNPASTDECLATIENLLKPEALHEARKKIKQYKPTAWDETFSIINKQVGDLL